MFTALLFVIAATALYSGAPWLFSLALTALLITIFPIVFLLVVIAAVAAWVYYHYR